jgi:hypothetical protein
VFDLFVPNLSSDFPSGWRRIKVYDVKKLDDKEKLNILLPKGGESVSGGVEGSPVTRRQVYYLHAHYVPAKLGATEIPPSHSSTVMFHEYLHPYTSTIDRSFYTACLFLLV